MLRTLRILAILSIVALALQVLPDISIYTMGSIFYPPGPSADWITLWYDLFGRIVNLVGYSAGVVALMVARQRRQRAWFVGFAMLEVLFIAAWSQIIGNAVCKAFFASCIGPTSPPSASAEVLFLVERILLLLVPLVALIYSLRTAAGNRQAQLTQLA
jgi:hypothetical protein